MQTDEIIQQAIKALEACGIILYPTDTLIGLGCDALNEEAVTKIYELKGREEAKPMSIACSNFEMIKEYAFVSEEDEKILHDFLPGPYTFLLDKKDVIPDRVTAGSKKIGVRIPDYQILLEIIENLGKPIITTSANQSGQPDIKTLNECEYKVDFVLTTPYEYAGPSTVFDLEEKRILREGIGAEELKKYFNR